MSLQVDSKNVQYSFDDNQVVLCVNTGVYSQDSVMGAAYVFTDRCYVLLNKLDGETLTITLTGQKPLDSTALQCLIGEFSNELLSYEVRQRIVVENRPLIEAIVSRSMGGATPPDLDVVEFDLSELEELELDDEEFDDPLGIAASWEDKFGKEKKERSEAKTKETSVSHEITNASAAQP